MGPLLTKGAPIAFTAALLLSATGGTAASAGLEAQATSAQLAKDVVKKKDLKRHYGLVTVVQPPTPGVGLNRIHRQGVCDYLDGGGGQQSMTVKLAKRQAHSIFRMGVGGHNSSKGLISILTEYNTGTKAKKRFAQVRQALRDCPSAFTAADGTVISQHSRSIGSGPGTALATFTTVSQSPTSDGHRYVVIRRTGKAVSFTRFTRRKHAPNGMSSLLPAKTARVTEKLSTTVAKRYLG